MKMAAVLTVPALAAAWPAQAGQIADDAMREARLISNGDMQGGKADLPGLFGNYPAARDASGTSWQPDSTSSGDGHRSYLQRSDAEAHFDYGSGRFSLTQAMHGPATLGLQSRVRMAPHDRGTARPELSGYDASYRGAWAADPRLATLAASYSFPVSGHGSVFGYVGVPGEPALGPPASYMRQLSGIDSPQAWQASHWLGTGGDTRVVTVGYTWRALKLEGSTFSGRVQDGARPSGNDFFFRDSTSTRLSYNPSPNWSFQLSRGLLSGLDQIEPDEEIRRVTMSATCNLALPTGNWQSTLAWGRNARKSRAPTMGYLLESTFRFNGAHALFGRLEQVGNEEQAGINASTSEKNFKLNRLTFGYYQEIAASGASRVDAGAFVSRYSHPAVEAATYRTEPTSVMLFIRMNLR